MKSYTQGRNLAGIWAKNPDTTNLTYLDQTANDAYRHILAMKDWPFLEALRTLLTIANTQFVALPYDCGQVKEIAVVPAGSSTRYTPSLSPSREHWDDINLSPVSSNIPEWYFVFAGQIGLWPTPSTSGASIFVTQKCKVIDLQFADVTGTANVTTVTTNGVTTLTVASAPFTASMVGRSIQLAAPSGDYQWYEIAGFTSTSIVTLVRAYGGTPLATTSAAFTISQFPLLPEDFHDTPWKRAAQSYWEKEDDKRADKFQASADADVVSLIRTWSAATTDMVIDDGSEKIIINPNLTINL